MPNKTKLVQYLEVCFHTLILISGFSIPPTLKDLDKISLACAIDLGSLQKRIMRRQMHEMLIGKPLLAPDKYAGVLLFYQHSYQWLLEVITSKQISLLK